MRMYNDFSGKLSGCILGWSVNNMHVMFWFSDFIIRTGQPGQVLLNELAFISPKRNRTTSASLINISIHWPISVHY